MQVFRHLPHCTQAQAIAIGNFDGMHLGLQDTAGGDDV